MLVAGSGELVVVGGVVEVVDDGRRRRNAGRRQQLLELILGAVLGSGELDAGAPQLIGDEAEHQQADDDQRLAEQAHEPAQIVRRAGAGRSQREVPPMEGTGYGR